MNQMSKVVSRKVWIFLAVAIVVLPLVTVQIIWTDTPSQPFVFQARILEKLEEVPFPGGKGGSSVFLGGANQRNCT
jgi:hypothetical protein